MVVRPGADVRTLIRMKAEPHAHHYLALSDGAKPLALYHASGWPSARQIMLYEGSWLLQAGLRRPGLQ